MAVSEIGESSPETRPTPPAGGVDDRTRVLLVAFRRALIVLLLAVEDYLNMPRSIPRRERGG